MSGSPLIFVRDERTLPYFPVTHNALAAIAIADDCSGGPKRLAAARSLYLAVLELANEQRSASVPASRKRLGELAGVSRDLVSDLRGVLERAQVVRVEERFHDNQQLEHIWVAIEPPRQAEPVSKSVSRFQHPVADSQGGGGAEPRGKAVEGREEEDSLRSSSSEPLQSIAKEALRSQSSHANGNVNGMVPPVVAPSIKPGPGPVALCRRLAELMLANDPKAKVEPESKRWLDSARLLVDTDGRHFEEALAVLEWSQRDEFERTVVLSMPKFRKRYPQLRLKWMQQAHRAALPPQSQWSAAAAPASTADLLAAYEKPRSRTGL
jgi:hypothetical protein